MEDNYKNNVNDKQTLVVETKKKANLLDILICCYFLILMILSFIYGFIESYYNASSCEAGGCSGFFIFGILITASFLGFPSTIGSIISAINIFVRKKVLTIFEVMILIFNIRLVFSDLVSNAHYVIFRNVIVILSIILIIICLFSMFGIFNKEKQASSK